MKMTTMMRKMLMTIDIQNIVKVGEDVVVDVEEGSLHTVEEAVVVVVVEVAEGVVEEVEEESVLVEARHHLQVKLLYQHHNYD